MNDALSRRVLVLNRLWQAVNIVGVRRAFALLMQESAQAIDTSDGNFNILNAEQWIDYSLQHPPENDCDSVHTVRLKLRVPHVLLLRHYDKVPTKEVKFNRHNVFERDGHTCQYCGNEFHERDLNLDHIIPRDMGGKTTWENIVTSCIKCNTRKANRLPHQAGMHLRCKPDRPRWRPFVHAIPSEEREDGWNHFLK